VFPRGWPWKSVVVTSFKIFSRASRLGTDAYRRFLSGKEGGNDGPLQSPCTGKSARGLVFHPTAGAMDFLALIAIGATERRAQPMWQCHRPRCDHADARYNAHRIETLAIPSAAARPDPRLRSRVQGARYRRGQHGRLEEGANSSAPRGICPHDGFGFSSLTEGSCRRVFVRGVAPRDVEPSYVEIN
jgi:hypothetical protein